MPDTRQYYYRQNDCNAKDLAAADCICWHDLGTGPFPDAKEGGGLPSNWRDKPRMPDTSPEAVPSATQCGNKSRALFEQWARTEFEDEFDGDRMDSVEWAWCAWQAARIAAPPEPSKEGSEAVPPVAPPMPDESRAPNWRCYHCGEVCTTSEQAREHFGATEGDAPACRLAPDVAGLVGLIRGQEDELRAYRLEDTEASRSYYRMGAEHSVALMREEEKGYARGLADGRALLTPPSDNSIVGAPEAEKSELRKDAERYRWLRLDSRPCDWIAFVKTCNGCGAFGACTEDELDAAIDAAMEAK